MHPFILNVLLDAETLVDTTAAGAQMPAPGWFARNSMWIMLLLIFGVMWLFMIRPQRKAQKEAENFRNALAKGAKVCTIGGIFGEIVEVDETTVLLKVDGDTKLRVAKGAIAKEFQAQQ